MIISLVLSILTLGFILPGPPGILGVLIEWYWLGGKQKHEAKVTKRNKVNNTLRKIYKEGKHPHDEIKLAREGKSKYFKIVRW